MTRARHHTVVAAIFSVSVAVAGGSTAFAGEPAPTLEIKRLVWALDENVFFWSGIHGDGDLVPEDIEGCGVEILFPDGSRRWQPALWPMDGNPARGWSGGHGLHATDTIEGSYQVRATCNDQTVEGSFEVRRMEILDDIELRIEFEPGCRGQASDETVSWVVENRSRFPLMVSPPKTWMMSGVSMELRHRDTEATCHGFVPGELLGVAEESDVMTEHLSWGDLEDIDAIPLAAESSVRRSFCLTDLRESDCAMAWPPGYVRMSALAQVLVGPRNGPWADQGPFRLSAREERILPPQLDLGEASPSPLP